MEMTVTMPHQDYSDGIRELVSSKLAALERFHNRIVSMRAVLAKERDDHRVEIIANVGRGVTLVVDSKEGRFGAALDAAVHRMGRVLNRHHGKRLDRRRRAHRRDT